ncbi:MAG: hypothetical protein H7315_13410, partial [Herminiimonas sp.]|nr:hypothetical protein [Herminiimonas sp.]
MLGKDWQASWLKNFYNILIKEKTMVHPVSRPTGSAAVQDLPGPAAADPSMPTPLELPSSPGKRSTANVTGAGRKEASIRRQLWPLTAASRQSAASTPGAAEAASTHVDSAPAASTHRDAGRTEATAGTQNSESTAAPDAATPNGPTGPHPDARPDLHETHPDPHAQGGDMMDQQKMLMKQQNEAMITQIQMQT